MWLFFFFFIRTSVEIEHYNISSGRIILIRDAIDVFTIVTALVNYRGISTIFQRPTRFYKIYEKNLTVLPGVAPVCLEISRIFRTVQKSNIL